MHKVKLFIIAFFIAFVLGLIMCFLFYQLFITISPAVSADGKHPTMPIGQFFMSILLSVVFSIVLLFWLYKKLNKMKK